MTSENERGRLCEEAAATQQATAAQPPCPETTLAILLGAKEWPRSESQKNTPSEPFKGSYRAMRGYLLDPVGLGLPRENLLDLFDDPRSQSQICDEIKEFLEERDRAKPPPADVLVYYVGHGETHHDHYYLLVNSSEEVSLSSSALRLDSLAEILKEKARHLRHYLIIDACFSGSANSAHWQSPEGATLLCSSSRDSLSKAESPWRNYTLFTEALLKVLTGQNPERAKSLSFREAGELTKSLIAKHYPDVDRWPLPEVHSPSQPKGIDIGNLPFFPNPSGCGTRPPYLPVPVASRRPRVLFAVAAFVCALAVGLAVVFTHWPDPKTAQSDLQVVVGVRGANQDELLDPRFKSIPTSRHLNYVQARSGPLLKIRYEMPYLSRLSQSQQVEGVDDGLPFAWNYPNLSIRVQNNSSRTVLPAEAILRVTKSEPLLDPVLLVLNQTFKNLVFVNEGWGQVVDPEVKFSITPLLPTKENAGVKAFQKETPGTFCQQLQLPVKNIPAALENDRAVTVNGVIEYGPQQRRHTIPFRTEVLLVLPSGSAKPPSFQYRVWLQAGKRDDYTVPLTEQASIAPGSFEHVAIRVASDKSARYHLQLLLLAKKEGGQETEAIGEQDIELAIFVPRTQSKLATTIEVKK